jgi:hypothetical protein
MGVHSENFSYDSNLTLLRMSEQIDKMAAFLEKLGPPTIASGPPHAGSTSPHDSTTKSQSFVWGELANSPPVRATRPPLPDPRLVRRIIRIRQQRARFFDGELFADPAWDMLLDLTAARAEHTRVSVTSLCIASGVPPTTALRWIAMMTEERLLQRVNDDTDRRRAFVALTDKTADAMARYFVELGADALFAI